MHTCIDYDASRSSISTCDDVSMLVHELHTVLQTTHEATQATHDELKQLILRVFRFFLR